MLRFHNPEEKQHMEMVVSRFKVRRLSQTPESLLILGHRMFPKKNTLISTELNGVYQLIQKYFKNL